MIKCGTAKGRCWKGKLLLFFCFSPRSQFSSTVCIFFIVIRHSFLLQFHLPCLFFCVPSKHNESELNSVSLLMSCVVLCIWKASFVRRTQLKWKWSHFACIIKFQQREKKILFKMQFKDFSVHDFFLKDINWKCLSIYE